jgi:adenosylcobinamide kinase / adenosylcobinamide-phosphate guanylyltransferase
MNKLIYVSGGQRSGKSSFAIKLAKKINENFGILVTAEAGDEEMEKRIAHHIKNRDSRIKVYEETINISSINFIQELIVIDCVTLWLSNLSST